MVLEFEFVMTKAAQNVWNISESFAKEMGHKYLGTEHILYGLVKNDLGIVSGVFKDNNINENSIYRLIEDIMGKSGSTDEIVGITPRLNKIMKKAEIEAKKIGSDYIGTEQIVVSLFNDKDSLGCKLAVDSGIDVDNIIKQLYRKIYNESSEVKNRKSRIVELNGRTSFRE